MAGCSDPSQVKVFKLIDGDRLVVSSQEDEAKVDETLGNSPLDVIIVQTDDEAEIMKQLKIAEKDILERVTAKATEAISTRHLSTEATFKDDIWGGGIGMQKEDRKNEEGEEGDISPGP